LPIVAASRTGAAPVSFQVGVCDDLNIASPADLGDGDWIYLRPDASGYILSGSNPRSVLFAVYRYLSEVGFRWIRPGRRGLVVPDLSTPLPQVAPIEERPSYHYRTICIEGACSFEHVRDLIDWQTKHGMNGYFIQFEYGAYFLKRWYEHIGNPYWKGEPFSMNQARQVGDKVIAEINKRGLSFERVGHGWTCEVLGLPAEGWEQYKKKLAPGKQQWLAQIDGKRELFHGVPLNTNLCYSDPGVRAAMTKRIAAYAAAHPEVNLLHFWLADGSNNQCECEGCQTARPSDFYVDMLNELDARLTKANLPTKIVFLIYVDLLWPPDRSTLHNPDRFVLMFAPITRSYAHSFAASPDDGEGMTDYVRNQLQMPISARANIEYLQQWQKLGARDSFDFDYHLIWACYYDPNQYALARVLHQDIRALHKLDLQGLNSVQNQRISFPHNLLMDVLAHTLWNKKRSFDDIARDSFNDAYAEAGPQVHAFFKEMSRLWQPFFEPVFIPAPDARRIAAGRRNLKKMQSLIADLKPLAQTERPAAPEAIQWSWKYLAQYLDILEKLLPAYDAYLERSPDCRAKFEAAFDFLWQNEKKLHPVLDVSTFIGVLGWRIHEAENATETALAGGV
ncbi:MAG TPA: DUF4838 domain-containing protein, partial [Abditibacteriaceae bacterium]|nr:DUF4838 domain-containing protein [Abditibacteriaceae bacterium]